MAAIGKIRNQGWLLIGLMILSLIAFILMGSESGGGGNAYQANDDLAIVDGEAVSNTEFSDRVRVNVNNYKQQSQSATLSEADMNAIRNNTYNQMLAENILNKKYDKLGITVSDDEFRDMITGSRVHEGISNSFKDASGNFDLDAFNNYINDLNIDNPGDEPGTKLKTWKNFENAIVTERLTKKFNTLVEKSLTIPTVMAKDQYMNEQTQVNFDYVKIPYSAISDSSISLSDSDLKAFMAKNKKKFEKEASVDLKIASFPLVFSQNDKADAEKWMNKKVAEWKESKSDSAFISLYSDEAFDMAYYGENELVSQYKDQIFEAEKGTMFGYDLVNDTYIATKLVDKKMIPDSLKARHLLISFENIQTQEEAFVKRQLFDSLYNLVKEEGYKVEDLTAEFSDDQSNKNNGGDLKTVKPGQMVKPFNDLIFFNMQEGDVKMVGTQFGLHIVEVYDATPTKEAVQIATLKKQILPSQKTGDKTYAASSIFSGNNNTKDKFLAAGEEKLLIDAVGVSKDANTVSSVQGNARQIVKWAFNDAKVGEVSTPFFIGDAYYVVLLVNKNEKGLPNISDNNRLAIQVDAINAKKAEKIKAKISGSDLNAIATANGVSASSASSASFTNVAVEGVSEPKVVGVALGLAEGTVSEPIEGNEGVYVISVSSKSAPQDDPTAYLSNKASIQNQLKFGVTGGLNNAIIKSADVKDNRLDFF